MFLEACQTAQSEDDAVKSVAAALLTAGIVSVVAMTHNVLVVTAELFVRVFYIALAQGQRIGAAMLAAQRVLMTDKTRRYFIGFCRNAYRIYKTSSGNWP